MGLLTQMVPKFINDLHFGSLTKLLVQMVHILFIIRGIGPTVAFCQCCRQM